MKVGVDRTVGLVVIDGEVAHPIAAALGVPDGHPDPLRWVLEHVDEERVAEAGRAVQRAGGSGVVPVPVTSLRLAAPIARPPKLIAAPVNYRDHQVEMHEQQTIAEYGVFLKAPTSVIGPDGTVRLPYADVRTDQEGELAIVMGRGGRDIAIGDAFEHVFGYTCLIDVSVRSTEDRSTRKSFDTFTPVGPWVVTRDEVGDPAELNLSCWVGDALRQSAPISDLIYSVPLLVAYASSVMTLEPGDLIATGTPAGVGPVQDGDVIRVHISRIGEFQVNVAGPGIPYSQRPALLDA